MSLPIRSSVVLARDPDDRLSDAVVPTFNPPRSSSGVSYVDYPDAPLSAEDYSPPADSPVSPSADGTLPAPSQSALDPSGVDVDAMIAARSDAGAVPGTDSLLPVDPVRPVPLVYVPDPSPEPVGREESRSVDRPTVSLGVQTRPLIRKRGTCL